MRSQLALSFVLLAVLSGSFFVGTARAQIELTEVNLATNEIELTNIGGSVETGGILEWCIPFVYGVLETAGYSFLPGETRTYDLGFNVSDPNDLWIYRNRTGGFGQTDLVISGVVWGADQSNQGRVNSVVTNTGGEAWAMNTDFVSTAGILKGQTMQMIAPALNPNSSTGWTLAESTLGSFGATTDVNLDGTVDCDDLTQVIEAVANSTNDVAADLTGDGIVDAGDRDTWLREAGGYSLGDANFDNVVDGADFAIWSQNKFQDIGGYCNGDFNGDQSVDAHDFLIWNENKSIPQAAVNAVPEPKFLIFAYLMFSAMLAILRDRRRSRR